MDFFFTVGNCGIKLLSFLSENNLFLMNSRKITGIEKDNLTFLPRIPGWIFDFFKIIFSVKYLPRGKKFAYC